MNRILDLFMGDPVYDEQKNVIRRDFGVKNIVALLVVGFIGYSLMGKMKPISGKRKMKGGVGSYHFFDDDLSHDIRYVLAARAAGAPWALERSNAKSPDRSLDNDGLHADFIFAVAGEEFGLVMTLLIVGLFLFVVLRGFARAFKETDLFVQLAVAGLLVQFGLQAIINMASTLNLMPTKGMTLPLISYGGSSMLSLAIGLGMVLALTRERPGQENAWRDLGGKDMGGRLI